MISHFRQRGRAGDDWQLDASWLATMLVLVSLTELIVLRIGTRTAVHLPDLEDVREPYRVVATVGRLAFYLSILLLIALLVRLAVDLVRAQRSHMAAILIAFVVASWLASQELVADATMGWVTIGAVVVLGAAAVSRWLAPIGVPISILSIAFVAAAVGSILQGGGWGATSDALRHLTVGSEYLAVAAAISIGPFTRRALGVRGLPSSPIVIGSVVAGVVVVVAMMANPSTAHILMLWNFGLTGALPSPLYGAALSSVILGAGTAWWHAERQLATGIVLICLAGLGLISTYQSGLLIVGLALLVSSSRPHEVPSVARDVGENDNFAVFLRSRDLEEFDSSANHVGVGLIEVINGQEEADSSGDLVPNAPSLVPTVGLSQQDTGCPL